MKGQCVKCGRVQNITEFDEVTILTSARASGKCNDCKSKHVQKITATKNANGMKECFRCKVVKPLDDFYQHDETADGYLGKCKECTKADALIKYNHKMQTPEGRAKERARGREKYHRLYEAGMPKHPKPVPPEKSREYTRRWREKNALKLAAHRAVSKVVRNGTLIPQLCEVCNEVAETHHEDYNKPLEVKWLCVKHHKVLHHKDT